VTLPRDHEAEGMTTVNQDQVVTQTPEKEISAEEISAEEISAEDEEASLSRPQLRVISALHFRITSANSVSTLELKASTRLAKERMPLILEAQVLCTK